MLDPMAEAFTPDVARKIAEMRAAPELLARIADFPSKSSEGTLSSDEEAEYKEFVEALDVVSLIQAKTRRFLAS